MKSIFIILTVVLFLFSGCPKKEDAGTERKIPAESIKVEEKQPVAEESFSVDSNVSAIRMISLSTGDTVSLGDFKGKKIVIDFWSSWCVPCIEMFPVYNKLKENLEDKEGTIKVLSVNLDPLPAKARKIMKEKEVKFEVLRSPESLINSGILLPFTAIADVSGKIITTVNGKHTYEELLKLIEGEKN